MEARFYKSVLYPGRMVVTVGAWAYMVEQDLGEYSERYRVEAEPLTPVKQLELDGGYELVADADKEKVIRWCGAAPGRIGALVDRLVRELVGADVVSVSKVLVKDGY